MTPDDPRQLDGDEDSAGMVRDAGDLFVAALQESDTAIDVAADAATDAVPWHRRHRLLTAGGILVALLGIVVARRRG